MKDSQDRPRRAPPKVEYANYFEVGHNAFEIAMDFGYGHDEEPICHTRIVTSPRYVKVLLEILRESIAQYEAKYGEIDAP